MILQKPVVSEGKACAGSMTVEASIVIPIILLCITALIYLGLLLYQRSLLQSGADRAAEMGAAAWLTPSADIGTGRTDLAGLESEGLYRRIHFADEHKSLDRIEAYAENILKKRSLLLPLSSEIKAELKDYIVYKRLEVTAEYGYRIPAGRFLRLFGASDVFKLRVRSCSVVDDPTELIRNTDFVIDVEKELEEKYPGLKNIGDKSRGLMEDIKGRLGDFLE